MQCIWVMQPNNYYTINISTQHKGIDWVVGVQQWCGPLLKYYEHLLMFHYAPPIPVFKTLAITQCFRSEMFPMTAFTVNHWNCTEIGKYSLQTTTYSTFPHSINGIETSNIVTTLPKCDGQTKKQQYFLHLCHRQSPSHHLICHGDNGVKHYCTS